MVLEEVLGNQEGGVGFVYLAILLLLLFYIVSGSYLEHLHIKWIHETGLGIIVGFLVGGLIRFTYPQFYDENFSFNTSFFFYVVLPPIIFSGGYNLKKRRFFQNFYYISIYGVFGTIINFIIVAAIIIPASNAGWIINSNDGSILYLSTQLLFTFSATICATDSVAALAMIQSDKYPKLFSVIFGEGMVNDAVAIILYQTVETLFGDNENLEAHWYTPFEILLGFIINAIVSVLVGAFFALCCTVLIRQGRFLTHSATIETSITFIFGYLSYIVCEQLGFSGVIAILVAGIIMAHYNLYNLSDVGSASTGVTFQTLALMTEAYLYLFLGLSSWNVFYAYQKDYAWSWSFFLLGLGICVLARFFGVFVLSWIAMIFQGRYNWRLNRYQMGIIWFAGIIRGAIAFALISKQGSHSTDPQTEATISTVLFIVILTTILLGGLMPTYISVSLDQIKQNSSKYTSEHPSVRDSLIKEKQYNQMGQDQASQKFKSQSQKFWKDLDEKYVKPFLIFDYEGRKESIRLRKVKVKGAMIQEESKNSYIGHFQKVQIQGYLAPVFEIENQRFSLQANAAAAANISLSQLEEMENANKNEGENESNQDETQKD